MRISKIFKIKYVVVMIFIVIVLGLGFHHSLSSKVVNTNINQDEVDYWADNDSMGLSFLEEVQAIEVGRFIPQKAMWNNGELKSHDINYTILDMYGNKLFTVYKNQLVELQYGNYIVKADYIDINNTIHSAQYTLLVREHRPTSLEFDSSEREYRIGLGYQIPSIVGLTEDDSVRYEFYRGEGEVDDCYFDEVTNKVYVNEEELKPFEVVAKVTSSRYFDQEIKFEVQMPAITSKDIGWVPFKVPDTTSGVNEESKEINNTLSNVLHDYEDYEIGYLANFNGILKWEFAPYQDYKLELTEEGHYHVLARNKPTDGNVMYYEIKLFTDRTVPRVVIPEQENVFREGNKYYVRSWDIIIQAYKEYNVIRFTPTKIMNKIKKEDTISAELLQNVSFYIGYKDKNNNERNLATRYNSDDYYKPYIGDDNQIHIRVNRNIDGILIEKYTFSKESSIIKECDNILIDNDNPEPPVIFAFTEMRGRDKEITEYKGDQWTYKNVDISAMSYLEPLSGIRNIQYCYVPEGSSINDVTNWETYNEPFTVDKDCNGTFYFRSESNVRRFTAPENYSKIVVRVQKTNPVNVSCNVEEAVCNSKGWYQSAPPVAFRWPDVHTYHSDWAPLHLYYELYEKRQDGSSILVNKGDCQQGGMIEPSVLCEKEGHYDIMYWVTNAAGVSTSKQTLEYRFDATGPQKVEIVLNRDNLHTYIDNGRMKDYSSGKLSFRIDASDEIMEEITDTDPDSVASSGNVVKSGSAVDSGKHADSTKKTDSTNMDIYSKTRRVVSGVSYYEYALLKKGSELEDAKWTRSDRNEITLKYTKNFSGNLYVRVYDQAGNVTTAATNTKDPDGETIIIDIEKPAPPVIKTNGYQGGTWTNKDVRITLGQPEVENLLSGIWKYQITKTPSEEDSWVSLSESDYSITHRNQGTENKVVVDLENDNLSEGHNAADDCRVLKDGVYYLANSFSISEDTDQTYYLRAISNSMLVSEVTSIQVKVRKSCPDIPTILVNENAVKGENDWYVNRFPEIKIASRIQGVDRSNDLEITTYYKVWNSSKGEKESSVAVLRYDKTQRDVVIPVKEDGIYHFKVWVVDGAGNQCVDEKGVATFASNVVKVNVGKPTLTVQVNERQYQKVTLPQMIRCFNQAPQISIKHHVSVSGIKSVDYQLVEKKGQYDPDGKWLTYHKISMKNHSQFVLYVRVIDNAGNTIVVSTDQLIIDEAAGIRSGIPNISIELVQLNDQQFSNRDVTALIKVKDPKWKAQGNNGAAEVYSGIKKITYCIDRNGKLEQSGTLFELEKKQLTEKDLIEAVSKSILLDADSLEGTDLNLRVLAEDQAGNTAEKSTKLHIDITKPMIEVRYENGKQGEQIFNEFVSLTVQVMEKNFDSKLFDIVIMRDNQNVTSLYPLQWKKEGEKNSVQIKLQQDGDYQITLGCKDVAGNLADYQKVESFTIDTTKPVLNLMFEDKDAVQNTYYNIARKATISIKERNFQPEVNLVITANRPDGTKIQLTPATFSNEGDLHLSSLSFEHEGWYQIELTYQDASGNVAENKVVESFYVDLTAPEITVEGLDNNQSYNQEITPVIHIKDWSVENNNYQLTLTGKRKGAIVVEGQATNRKDEVIFEMKPIQAILENDDIYEMTITATDKAGNRNTKRLDFSLNRFGSVYYVEDSTKELLGKHNKEVSDLHITESNIDHLKEITIKCNKNGSITTLTEGTHYTVEQQKDEKDWKNYHYCIFADNFTEDGFYSVTILSKDIAGNASDNKIKNLDIQFYVDRSNPSCIATGISANSSYNTEAKTINFSVQDNVLLQKAVLYIDGEEKYSWDKEALKNSDGSFSYVLQGAARRQNIELLCLDEAGNETKYDIMEVLVTTDKWIRFYETKWLFYGTIALIVSIAGVILAWRVKRRRGMATANINQPI